IAEILDGNARSEEALRLAEQALETIQNLHPGNHPYVAATLNAVAACLQSLGRSADALRDSSTRLIEAVGFFRAA
ncbi:MAG: tetratricopeptide repeat protein, partial [Proteobacteria bacterium]|nr:tetratricopeptide repeat protein [Pseudomonadota bacterium]